eukprot:Opistho-1_new@40720
MHQVGPVAQVSPPHVPAWCAHVALASQRARREVPAGTVWAYPSGGHRPPAPRASRRHGAQERAKGRPREEQERQGDGGSRRGCGRDCRGGECLHVGPRQANGVPLRRVHPRRQHRAEGRQGCGAPAAGLRSQRGNRETQGPRPRRGRDGRHPRESVQGLPRHRDRQAVQAPLHVGRRREPSEDCSVPRFGRALLHAARQGEGRHAPRCRHAAGVRDGQYAPRSLRADARAPPPRSDVQDCPDVAAVGSARVCQQHAARRHLSQLGGVAAARRPPSLPREGLGAGALQPDLEGGAGAAQERPARRGARGVPPHRGQLQARVPPLLL